MIKKFLIGQLGICLMLVCGLLPQATAAYAADKSNPTFDVRNKKPVDKNLLKFVKYVNESNNYYYENLNQFDSNDIYKVYENVRDWAWYYKYYFQRALSPEEVALSLDPTSPGPSEFIDLYNNKTKLKYCLADIRYFDSKPHTSDPLTQRLVLSDCATFVKGKTLLPRILPRKIYAPSPFKKSMMNGLYDEFSPMVKVNATDSELKFDVEYSKPEKIKSLKLYFEWSRFGKFVQDGEPSYTYEVSKNNSIVLNFSSSFTALKQNNSIPLTCANPGLNQDWPLVLKVKFVETFSDKTSISGYLNPYLNVFFC
jgi:hypothetical protein